MIPLAPSLRLSTWSVPGPIPGWTLFLPSIHFITLEFRSRPLCFILSILVVVVFSPFHSKLGWYFVSDLLHVESWKYAKSFSPLSPSSVEFYLIYELFLFSRWDETSFYLSISANFKKLKSRKITTLKYVLSVDKNQGELSSCFPIDNNANPDRDKSWKCHLKVYPHNQILNCIWICIFRLCDYIRDRQKHYTFPRQ